MTMINIGCGDVFHPAWINLDVLPVSAGVRRLDARRPLPFADGTVDAVYHSHVLEHLTSEEAELFLRECFRVLRPGGVVRVVVPDLAGIARAYLDALRSADSGGDPTLYEWCRFELTDQLTRAVSGGEMERWLRQISPEQRTVVRQRAGDAIVGIGATGRRRPNLAFSNLVTGKSLRWLHRHFVRGLVGLCGGRNYLRAFDEGVFRQRGEVHRVMYDHFALSRILRQVGFADARVVNAVESRITGFSSYELDAVGDVVRKPDSLFLEAQRP